jgi:hypothetical protein
MSKGNREKKKPKQDKPKQDNTSAGSASPFSKQMVRAGQPPGKKG